MGSVHKTRDCKEYEAKKNRHLMQMHKEGSRRGLINLKRLKQARRA
jgi:hypothetical protein